MTDLTIDELHQYLQSFQIEAILDRGANEIKTRNFLIRKTANGYEVTEKKCEMQFVKTRIVAREISEKRNP